MTKDKVYSFAAHMQCCLGEKAMEVLAKASTGSLCPEDRKRFIMAHIFNKIIRVYNPGSLPRGKVKFIIPGVMFPQIRTYHMDNIIIGGVLISDNSINFTGTFVAFLNKLCDEINNNSGFFAYIDGDVFHIIAPDSGWENLSVYISSSSYTINGGEANNVFSDEILFSMYEIPYACLSEELMCDMINYLKNYCNNDNNCNCK